MSRFFDLLKVETADGTTWTTLEEMSYEIGEVGSGLKITVPAGRKTDFGSVPKPLHGIISPIGTATRAYVLHDDLYKRQFLTRWMSDLILLEAMNVLAMEYPLPRWKRRAVYWGVRGGGFVAWAKHRKANASGENAG